MDTADVTSQPAPFDLRAALGELHATTDPGEFLAMIQRVNDAYRANQEANARTAEPVD